MLLTILKKLLIMYKERIEEAEKARSIIEEVFGFDIGYTIIDFLKLTSKKIVEYVEDN